MAPLCGKPLSPDDRDAWRQAIALLMGLKIRNGFDDKELTAAVGTALHVRSSAKSCEDCGLKVASGAANAGRGKGQSVPLDRAISKLARPPTCIESPASNLRNERE
jgi:hypothetical protein